MKQSINVGSDRELLVNLAYNRGRFGRLVDVNDLLQEICLDTRINLEKNDRALVPPIRDE